MNWLERARREIPRKCPAAYCQYCRKNSNGSNGSAPILPFAEKLEGVYRQ